MTDGAIGEAARRFLADRPERVLEKPLDAAALDAMLERLAADSSTIASSTCYRCRPNDLPENA